MSSTRAADVATILWELKRAGKVATYSTIANRAGFSAGANGRAMLTCLKTVRRDWPHLQWWRAIHDTGTIEKGSEAESKLREAGFPLETADGSEEAVILKAMDDHLMTWEESTETEDATSES